MLQTQELLLRHKIKSKPHLSFTFINDIPVHQVQLQKYLDLPLDPKLSFHEHIQCT